MQGIKLIVKGRQAKPLKDLDSLALEAIMTESAFGHEYTLMNLHENVPFSSREAILAELDAYKKNYFWARTRMEQLNPSKLHEIEADLKAQKQFFQNESRTVH